jgi:hypothetical protein
MFGNSTESGRPALLLGTIKVAALVVCVSFLAASWLSAGPLDRLASHAEGFDDPVTTGSIARTGNQTRLDPCAAPLRH